MSTPLIISHTYPAPADKVWQAITNPQQMRKWYFEMMPDFEPRAGFETSFSVHANDNDYLHHWIVREVVPGKKIRYDWLYPDYPGHSTLTWELEPGGDDTKVTLTHSGIESFPQNNKDFARESFTGGWNYFLHERLKEYLEK